MVSPEPTTVNNKNSKQKKKGEYTFFVCQQQNENHTL